MKKVNLDIVEVDIHTGPLAISVSGGADSAILLYILMSNMNADDALHVFSCSSKEKNNVSPHYTLDVVTKCINLTGKKNVQCHVNYVEKQTLEALFLPMSFFYNKGLVRYIYTGVTTLPPLEICETFKNGTPLIERRDPRKIHPTYRGEKNHIYVPFANINKKDIASLYEKFGRMEDLFPLTRSCESLTLKSGHCGECWWCEERFWAFGKYE